MIYSHIKDLCFEPFIVVALLGILLYISPIRRQNNIKYGGLILFLLIIMLLWRCFLANESSRYWAIILIPCFIFGTYFCFQSFWGVRISRILVAIILVICLIKDFRLNYNGNAIINVADVITENAKNWQSPVCIEYNGSNIGRIAYYSDILCLPGSIGNVEELDGSLHAAQGVYDIVYLYTHLSAEEETNMQSHLNKYGGELIYSQNKDMRNKDRVCLYAIPLPTATPIEPQQITIIANGDFEEWEIKDTGLVKPKLWGVYDRTYFQPTKDSSIAGETSIMLEAKRRDLLYSPPIKSNTIKQTLTFEIKGSLGAQIDLIAFYYDKMGKLLEKKNIMKIILPTDELYQIQIPQQPIEEPNIVNFRYFWYITAPDGIIIDNVGFYNK